MPTIFVKDEMRAAVEAASGGRQTVLYTQSGQPSIMNVIPAFNLEDIDPTLGTGVHPAFVVGGMKKSEIFIGTYQGIIKNGELLSLPGVEPTNARNHDQMVVHARNAGPGWHCTTHVEWSAIALWCFKNGFMPRGNTNFGQSADATYEAGRRADGAAPGVNTTNGRTLTGSGPASWRHDNTANGIADLCGNMNEWALGVRLMDGEIQVIPNNDAALNSTDLSKASTAWRAIRATDGALVAPSTTGTLKFDSTIAGSVTNAQPVLSNEVTNRNGEIGDDLNTTGAASRPLQALTAKEGLTVPGIVKALGLFPVSDALGGDNIWMRNYGERLASRGGNWTHGIGAGVFSIDIREARVQVAVHVGARPAFVI